MLIRDNIIYDMLNYTESDTNNVDVEMNRHCEAYNKVIDCDLCYDSMMCLNGYFSVSSTSELNDITDIEKARDICKKCIFSNI